MRAAPSRCRACDIKRIAVLRKQSDMFLLLSVITLHEPVMTPVRDRDRLGAMTARRTIRHPKAKRGVSRAAVAWLLAITLTFSFFHASACEAEIRQPSAISSVTEQSAPAPQPASHPLADHCMLHLLGDIIHPANVTTVQDVEIKLSWRDDPAQPVSAPDSPFKPPRG